jgi:DNA invertase Pin-like site-specific DNA recombinase
MSGSSNEAVSSYEQEYDVPVANVGISKYENLSSKSAKIRTMYADGYTRSQIAKILGIRYQHVRNVLITPISRK